MTLRLLEHYVSVQGEGPNTGIPTQFVRFAGCNLKCPGWPCDTPFAIDPKLYRLEQRNVMVRVPSEDRFFKDTGLVMDIANKFDRAYNVCLTGGEPLLQPNAELIDLACSLTDNWDMSVEMFTNGSLPIPEELLEAPVSIVMDWKLSGSGDFDKSKYGKVREGNLEKLAENYPGTHAIKFVCRSLQDVREAIKDYYQFDLVDWPGSKYFGVVWNGDLSVPDLVDFLIQSDLQDWRLNLQSHNYIWPAHERAR